MCAGGSVGVPLLLSIASLHSDSVHQSSKRHVVVFYACQICVGSFHLQEVITS
jgi:hypothetical protein